MEENACPMAEEVLDSNQMGRFQGHVASDEVLTKSVTYTQQTLYVVTFRRIYNDYADSYPHHVGKFFNFRIFIAFSIVKWRKH